MHKPLESWSITSEVIDQRGERRYRGSMETLQNGAAVQPSGVGPLLRRWREARHLSQLELALEAEVSSRHISFLETGRAEPSRAMLLTLANVLNVPLREQNFLLLAAGFVPIYSETGLDDPRMSRVRTAIEIILKNNEPRSAYAHDRHWNIVMANQAFIKFMTIILGQPPAGLEPLRVACEPRLNVLRLVFDPESVRKVIVNWETVAKSLLNEAGRRLTWARDDALKSLIDEMLGYPGVPARWREPDLEAPRDLILPTELKLGGTSVRMFSTVTALATPNDVTLQDLHIEAFYPADAETEALLSSPPWV